MNLETIAYFATIASIPLSIISICISLFAVSKVNKITNKIKNGDNNNQAGGDIHNK